MLALLFSGVAIALLCAAVAIGLLEAVQIIDLGIFTGSTPETEPPNYSLGER